MMPFISVVIPSNNHASYIQEAIESVLRQSYENFELIIVDDGSTDNSLELINGYRDKRIRVFQQSNKGAHAAINRGLELANGDYLTILNSDDRYHPSRLEKLLAVAQETGRLFCFSDLRMIDGESECYTGWRLDQYRQLKEECGKEKDNIFLRGNLACTTSNFFMSREAVDKVGKFYGLMYTHDWNWALRFSAQFKYIWLEEDLLDYRVHDSNTLLDSAIWNHIFEDSYNFSSYLHLMSKQNLTVDDLNTLYLRLFMGNESYASITVSLFLSYLQWGVVKDEKELLVLLHNDSFRDRVIKMIEDTKFNSDIFLSYKHLSRVVNKHDEYGHIVEAKQKELSKVTQMLELEMLKYNSYSHKIIKKIMRLKKLFSMS